MPLEPFKLTPEQKKALLDLTADMNVIELEIARAKRAGIDVTDLEADYKKAKALRDGILKEYA